MRPGCFVDGVWREGGDGVLSSVDPATGATLWESTMADQTDVADAVEAAQRAQPAWDALGFDRRVTVLERFAALLDGEAGVELAHLISAEAGKPRWEAATEVASVKGKVALSIEAYRERTSSLEVSLIASLSHRPLGVMGVLGPFNFPAHLPNGQIVPALLAGNAVVYKPSELTPAVAIAHVALLAEAGLPAGVLNLVVGDRGAGEALVAASIDGLAFTGSVGTGRALHRALAGRPEVLLALEMGGNNPLVVADYDDLAAAVNVMVRSAFTTAGQRCTCARRIYVPRGPEGDVLLEAFVAQTDQLRVGAPSDAPEPFLGPVISVAAADRVRSFVADMEAAGAQLLTRSDDSLAGTAFVRPTILSTEGVAVPDDEVFGPVVTVDRFDDLDTAFASAADTAYGLAAGLIGTRREDFDRFLHTVKAGVVNWNAPTTGASGRLPFGGVGASGNHRPAGWTTADFCAYPTATVAHDSVTESASPLP